MLMKYILICACITLLLVGAGWYLLLSHYRRTISEIEMGYGSRRTLPPRLNVVEQIALRTWSSGRVKPFVNYEGWRVRVMLACRWRPGAGAALVQFLHTDSGFVPVLSRIPSAFKIAYLRGLGATRPFLRFRPRASTGELVYQLNKWVFTCDVSKARVIPESEARRINQMSHEELLEYGNLYGPESVFDMHREHSTFYDSTTGYDRLYEMSHGSWGEEE